MIRYEALFGHVEIQGKAYPIIVCEVLAEDMITAELTLDIMGFTDALLRPTAREFHHREYNLN